MSGRRFVAVALLLLLVAYAAPGAQAAALPEHDFEPVADGDPHTWETPEDLLRFVETELSQQAAALHRIIEKLLDELDNSGDEIDPFPGCEPVTVTVHINETNPNKPVDPEVWVQPECLPG